MKSKRIFGVIAILLCCLLGAQAQETEKKKHSFDKQQFFLKRNAYIIAEVNLSAEEASLFIPLENEMKEQLFRVASECRRLTRAARGKTLTQQEYERIIDCKTEARLKEAELEKEYMVKFKKILSSEKLYRYLQAETKFMRDYMRENKRNR